MILPARNARRMFAEYAGDWRSADFDFTNCGLDSAAADGPAEAELSRSRLRAARSSSSSFRSRELRASESGRSSVTFDGPEGDGAPASDGDGADAAASDGAADARATASGAAAPAGDGEQTKGDDDDERDLATARLRGLWGPERSKRLGRELSEYSTDMIATVSDSLLGACEESFYSRAMTKCALEPAPTVETALLSVATLAMIFVQIASINTIRQFLWYLKWGGMVDAHVDDDAWLAETFRAGVPYPVDFHHDIDDGVLAAGVPSFLVPPMFFCSLLLGITVSGAMRATKASYVVLRWAAAHELEHVTLSGAAHLCVAWTIHVARLSLVAYFALISVAILGTADGPFNLLLNSLAMCFIFEIEVLLRHDVPSHGFFGALDRRVATRHLEWRLALRDVFRGVAADVRAAAEHPALRVVYRAYETLGELALGALVLTVTWAMQRRTTRGDIVTNDDDWITDTPGLTRIYKGCGLAIFSLLVFDCHFAWFFASKDRRKRPWLRVLAFLVDLAAVAVVVIVAVEWAVGWLMSWNLSAKSHPFEWTDFSIAPKRPADYDDYYAYDYAGDYGG